MIKFFKSVGWYLYGGVSCYCLQRFLIDFVYIKNTVSPLVQSGDIFVLDIWNRSTLIRNNLIFAISPDDHRMRIFGTVIGFSDETVRTISEKGRSKFVTIPKGNIAVKLLNDEKTEIIKILPIALVEGRVFGRIWPLKRYSSCLLMRSTSDI